MGNRHELRTEVSLPIRVSGLDANGDPFVQTATTIDVSRTGARICEIRCLRQRGEMVTVEYAGRSSRFQVVWIGVPGSDEDGHAGLKSLQPEKLLWRTSPNVLEHDPYVAAETGPAAEEFAVPVPQHEKWDGQDRRGAARRRCAGTAQITQTAVAFPTWAHVADISLGGCYLEMVFTIPVKSAVKLKLTIAETSFAAEGMVVTSHPGVGIGVKFTEMSPADEATLTELMQNALRDRRRPAPAAQED